MERALAIPEADLPQPPPPAGLGIDSDEHVVGQLLGMALLNQCSALTSPSARGDDADLRDLVRWHQRGGKGQPPPSILQGWRATVCGDLPFRDVINGKIAVRRGQQIGPSARLGTPRQWLALADDADRSRRLDPRPCGQLWLSFESRRHAA